MEKRLLWKHTDTNRRSPALAAWFCLPLFLLLLLVCASALPTTAEAAETVYVSSSGNDESGDGTKGKPYATLAKAATEAEDNATIYVMNDLTMNQSARFWDKNLTITSAEGEPYTIKRGENFAATNDPARNGYNGALIEVGGTDTDTIGSLTLTNITLDDNGLAPKDVDGKSYYIQAASDGDGNTEFGSEVIDNTSIVQDAIIAAYNGKGNIILGEGTTLKNYGGMSAIRMSGGTLTMKNGSKICDESGVVIDRTKGTEIAGAEKGLYGPAGAIWLQGGTLEMEQGAVIDDIIGRAIYADSCTVNIGGTISDIKSDGDMWQGTTGLVLHLRSNASGTMSETGEITNISGNGSIIQVIQGSFTMDSGSVIKDSSSQAIEVSSGNLGMNGKITGLTENKHAINLQGNGEIKCIIGSTGEIVDNQVAYGAVYIQGPNIKMDFYGKINNNYSTDRAGAIALANNFAGHTVTMYDGAEICSNVSTQTGGAVMVSCGKFTMNGGTIQSNISGVSVNNTDDQVGGGIYVRRGGTFIMNGGEITENISVGVGGGIAFSAGSYHDLNPSVQLNDGTVSGNFMNATVTVDDHEVTVIDKGVSNDVTVVKTESSNLTRYLTIDNAATVDNPNIYMEKYNLTLLDPQRGIKIGNAAAACETTAKEAYKDDNLTEIKGSFWYQSANDFTLDLSGLTYDSEKELYAALVETTADGTPVNPSSVQLRTVSVNGDKLSLSLPGNENGYAVVFLQEAEIPASIVTVTPADITVYMGGDGGYDAVVGDSENTGTFDNSLPHPMFRINAPNGVDPKNLTFKNGEKTWSVISDGNGYYHFSEGNVQDKVRVTYTNAAGEKVLSDDFEPADVGDVFTTFRIDLYPGDNNFADVTVTGEGDTSYGMAVGFGTLTVRAVADDDPTRNIEKAAPTEKLTAGTAMAVEPAGGTTYTLNDTEVNLPLNDAKPSLLFDSIIESEDSTARTDALKVQVDKKLGTVGGNTNRYYEIKYLDLVDAKNGNAWITSSAGTDIYWAYPNGTDENTEFTLLHFEGLHRDGTDSGFMIEDISKVTPEEIQIENMSQGIKFHIAAGGFSPFALVWEDTENDPDVPVNPPVDPNPPIDPDSPDDLNTEDHYSYIVGYEDGYVMPQKDITRAEVATIFYRLLEDEVRDEYDTTTNDFSDVTADSWYNQTVSTLARMGIVKGYEDGSFRPNAPITRAEFGAIATRFFAETGATYEPGTFTDVTGDEWFANAIQDAVNLGLIGGYPDGTVRPNNNITRAEACAIVNRTLGRVPDADHLLPEDVMKVWPDNNPTDWFYADMQEATNGHEYAWIEEDGHEIEEWTNLLDKDWTDR